jgi:hypothetical protein
VLVHLLEEKVFVQLWIHDTGATNHMSGSWVAFTDLDSAVCGIVCFSDASVAKIKGCGTILFLCKNGEHRLFFGVYYIMWLTENIVSVGQLDEAGFDIHIKEEAMMIHEPNR